MAAINDLINQIEDEELKRRINQELDKLTKQKKFGLVFEDHLPECTPLYDVPVKKGCKVALKTGKVNNYYEVLQIVADKVICLSKDGKKTEEFNKSDLVVIAEFGDPIYPYLQPIDSICNAPDSDLWHTLIQADNYHALQLLEYLYAEKVDCIYIDPPYNTGARDWKYNNDYVDSSDVYRHSKWLSMMEKRLRLSKKLLNPSDSVLIITIDEKEYLHLGCLLEEIFPEANIQMISTIINPGGVPRAGQFYRTNEYIFFVLIGNMQPCALPLTEDWYPGKGTGYAAKGKARWRPLRRDGAQNNRSDRPKSFYPIYVNKEITKIIGYGDYLPQEIDWRTIPERSDCYTIWPIKPDGTDGRWCISGENLMELFDQGYVNLGHMTSNNTSNMTYLPEGEREKVSTGVYAITGRRSDGSLILDDSEVKNSFIPGTQWKIFSHDATLYGTKILTSLLGKRFSFPKSLYAVHDAIRFFVSNKPNSLIVDFFAGSGTTLHAVNLLNEEDNGKRRCIMVTNNEVSEDEAKELRARGIQPGDEEWESLGIAKYVTWPRTVCSIKGTNISGNSLKGNYIGSEEPMANGLKSNAVFFKLSFIDKTSVALGKQFKEMLPLLWLKSGSYGKCPDLVANGEIPKMMILPQNKFAILVDENYFTEFEIEVHKYPEIQTAFLVTDFEKGFKSMTKNLKINTTYQLYRDYLDNFRINTERK